MGESNWNKIGNQLREAVEDSLDTGNFQQLGDVLSNTVISAVEETKRQISEYQNNIRFDPSSQNAGKEGTANRAWNRQESQNGQDAQTGTGQARGSGQNAQTGTGQAQGSGQDAQTGTEQVRGSGQDARTETGQARGNGQDARTGTGQARGNGQNTWTGYGQARRNGQYAQNPQQFYGNRQQYQAQGVQQGPGYWPVIMNKVGSVSGTLLKVFGGIATGALAIALLVLLIVMLGYREWDLVVPIGIVCGLLAVSIFLIEKGCRLKDRLKRAKRYVQLCGHCRYINIADLASQMGNTVKYTLKDVKKMLKAGFFPQGHLDQEGTCLMLDDATYRQYLSIQKERKAREMEEKVARMQAKQEGKQMEAPDGLARHEGDKTVPAGTEEKRTGEPGREEDPELSAMIREGQDCIRKLRDMNDNIEGEAISSKLFQLENLLKEIFERVRDHPEQMPQMQKFMKYYLPTTLKLVEAYEEYDSVSVPGEDILSAKAEIEKTLDTINQAFAELLNRLFRESVFDITTDAQVLQTMLAQEGLMKDAEFEKVKK